MFIKKAVSLFELNLLVLLAAMAGPLQALEEPDRSDLGQAEFRAAELNIEQEYRQLRELPAQAMANAEADLAALGLSSDAAFVDRRSGRWATLLLSEPLLPGKGNGNGGASGGPLPALGVTLAGQVAGAAGLYVAWRRRRKKTAPKS